jgi:acyl-homoserine lactone acylase PvdQ
LTGSKEKKILEWNLDLDKDFNILWIYSKDFVSAILDTLVESWFLYRTPWQYPKLWITQAWIASIYNNSILFDEEKDLQSSLYFKTRSLSNTENKKEKKDGTLKIQEICKVK